MRENDMIVSGKTLESIKHTTTPTSLTVTSARYIGVLQDGRSAGGLTPVENLVKWIEQKGIGGSEKENISFAWAIAKTHEKKGSRLYRGADPRFRKPTEIFEDAKAEALAVLKKDLTKYLRIELNGAIENGFK